MPPRYYFIVQDLQDQREVPDDLISDKYDEVGVVTVAGQPRIHIFEHAATPSEVTVFPLEALRPQFVGPSVPPGFEPELPYGDPSEFMQHSLSAELNGNMRLLGYSLDRASAEPGRPLIVTLFWQATAQVREEFEVVVQVGSEQAWATSRATPGVCGDTLETSSWTVGDVVVDRHPLLLDPATPLGAQGVTVWMERAQDRKRPTTSGESSRHGDSIQLADVQVEASPLSTPPASALVPIPPRSAS